MKPIAGFTTKDTDEHLRTHLVVELLVQLPASLVVCLSKVTDETTAVPSASNRQEASKYLDRLYDVLTDLEGKPQVSDEIPPQLMQDIDRLANQLGWYLDGVAPMKR